MRTIRDLRELVNVSRLSYKESDDEDEAGYNYTNLHESPSLYSFKTSIDFSSGSSLKANNSLSNSASNLGAAYLNRKQLADYVDPVEISLSSKANKSGTGSLRLKNMRFLPPPIISKTTPFEGGAKRNTPFDADINSRKSVFKDRDLLLDRNSLPSVSMSVSKKPLPPLNNTKHDCIDEEERSKSRIDSASERRNIEKSMEPLRMQFLSKKNQTIKKNTPSVEPENSSIKNGNFDSMLTYIDASVVSEWLNRANRSLRKMHRWHQDNSSLYEVSSRSDEKLLKYESFIIFANFWLGSNQTAKFDHKQRRQLIEMEYSILCDEVTQAFQVGIDSQKLDISDIHRLMHAVFKEYPLQMLSFRGGYLILDFIDILSSNRHDEYKQLLSDVKCRTINKQFAQWLLSIRSYSLINLCWSIIKFYRKTVETNVKHQANETRVLTARGDKKNPIEELDGRLSSISLSNNNYSSGCNNDALLNSSISSTSSCSSIQSSSSFSDLKPKSASKRTKSAAVKLNKQEFFLTSNQIKYDLYLKAAYKNDYPDVLHYLIVTKKCNPFMTDEQGRTLVFLAVMEDRPKILNYLIKRWPSIDVNQSCDSGNTALHAAVNKGRLNLVEIILKSIPDGSCSNSFSEETKYGSSDFADFSSETLNQRTKMHYSLDINKINEKCMNATALHLAVWNNYDEIALRLMQANADPYLKMNGISTAFDLAQENSNQVLFELLTEFSNTFIS